MFCAKLVLLACLLMLAWVIGSADYLSLHASATFTPLPGVEQLATYATRLKPALLATFNKFTAGSLLASR